MICNNFSLQRGIKKKIKGESAAHWLDLAKDKYDDQLVEDVKMVLRVLVIFIPIPVFWALFDQTGSRWTFQATRMNGALGSTTIKPDQMQVVNPILVLFMIPAFDRIIYPAFAKCGLLVKPLQRMCAGGFLTAVPSSSRASWSWRWPRPTPRCQCWERLTSTS